ncbi:MAG: glycosyltransferase family 2 protein [Cetobacterium sp.]
MNENIVEILMSTYNGEDFIKEQIESIINQTYTNWELLIRDDGSTDNTKKILKKYTKDYPYKIKILEDKKGNLKSKDSFLELLKNSKRNYIMFCDQDDKWYEDKVQKSLKKIIEVEKGPTLVHTDLEIVDKNLRTLHPSFWNYQKLNPQKKRYEELILKNNVTGCTIIINRELADLCMGEFKSGIMHDWIIAIIASLKGEIYFLNETTIKYRQHGKNTVGANLQKKKNGFYLKFKKIRSFKKNILIIKNQLQNILENIEVEDTEVKNKTSNFLKVEKNVLIKYSNYFKIIKKETIG